MSNDVQALRSDPAAGAVVEDTRVAMRTLVGMSSELARRGCGEPVIELALRRKGISPEEAKLIAVSVASCHTALLDDAESQATRTTQATRATHALNDADRRATRAASLVLSEMIAFIVFVVVGLGGGAMLGWGFGFTSGVEDGLQWLGSVLAQL